MTVTAPADAVVSGCAHTAPRRPAAARSHAREPASVWLTSRWQAFARPVFPGSASFKPAGRSCHPRSIHPLPHRQYVRTPCPRRPRLVHPLYLYLLTWHAATRSGWSVDPGSVDPGRDILCTLTSPLRWLRRP